MSLAIIRPRLLVSRRIVMVMLVGLLIGAIGGGVPVRNISLGRVNISK
jgi:cell division protein FtsL